MTTTIATIMVLVLYINDVPKEFMGHHENKAGKWVEMGMSGCLQMKRTLKRNGWKDSFTGQTRFACEKRITQVEERIETLRDQLASIKANGNGGHNP